MGSEQPVKRWCIFSGPPIRETLAKEFPQINQEELFQEFHDISWRLYPQYLKSFPFVKDALIELKKGSLSFRNCY